MHTISISMTEKGDPYEDAVAERVNGILKDEFNLYKNFINIHQANSIVQESIYFYNHERPHATCNYLTPAKPHDMNGLLNKRWKTYYKKKGRMSNHKYFSNPLGCLCKVPSGSS